MQIALITGMTGQDGYYMTKLLLEKGWNIHGICRQNSAGLVKVQELKDAFPGKLIVHFGDLTDLALVIKVLS